MTTDLHPLNESANNLRNYAEQKMSDYRVRPEFRALLFNERLRWHPINEIVAVLVSERRLHPQYFL